ncbi:hypothetical protein B6N58_06620 [Legionella micdadei]|nr:hypothetical protein B6N58_06620 [Legionella micdadei]ARH00331.1 hypothetical protein B6V88_07800 [Legionella micdadei]KTD28246.1 hypothetical protein Lmic_1357 [Legionella micdadei]SCY32012.1 hypothetical protein SAMN02982997_01379 [Legionella micdadei]
MLLLQFAESKFIAYALNSREKFRITQIGENNMDRSSLFRIIIAVMFCCLVVVGFAHTKDVFAQAAVADKFGSINQHHLMH